MNCLIRGWNMYRRIFLLLLWLVAVSVPLSAQQKQLTVDECVEIALEKNADLIIGQYIVDKAGKDVTLARSNFLPTVSADMGYYHSVVGPSSVMRIDPGTGIPVPVQPTEITSWSYSAGLSVRQTLFSGGYNIFNYRMNQSLKKSAEHNFESTRQTTIYMVKERYYNLLAAEKLLGVQEETIKSSDESYKRAQVLFEVGKASKSDVLKARVQLESTRLALIEAQNGLSIARASLNHVLGFEVDHEIQVVDDLNEPEMEVSYEEALESAYQSHPSLLKSRFDSNAANAGIKMAVSQYLPSFMAHYGYSWRHSEFDRIKELFDKDYNWYAGVSLSIPVFQGFARIAQHNKALLDYRSAEEALAQVKRDVGLETKQAFFDVQQSKKQIAVTQNALEAAEEDLRLNMEKYSLGAGTMLDLINAQVSLTQARSDNIQAMYTYKYAIARLYRAMGKLEK